MKFDSKPKSQCQAQFTSASKVSAPLILSMTLFQVLSIKNATAFETFFGWSPSQTTQIAQVSHLPTAFRNIVPANTGIQERAEQVLNSHLAKSFAQYESVLQNLNSSDDPTTNSAAKTFMPQQTLTDESSTTVKFRQTYRGVPVFGDGAMVHFNAQGVVNDVQTPLITEVLNTRPSLSGEEARRILSSEYGTEVSLSKTPELLVYRHFDKTAHLVWHLYTASTQNHQGMEALVDAHSGKIVLDFERTMHVSKRGGDRVVYSADTDKAHQNTDERGYPTDIDLTWYNKVIDNDEVSEDADRSAANAHRNAGRIFDYYKKKFGRNSYDDKGSRITSIVHMGVKMANAFWTPEFEVIAYGDGDGERLNDLTYALDVAAHEITHAVTSNTANLVYAAESGALNESFSDFFGRMVDYEEGNWDIGAAVVAPGLKRRAIRNMRNPEEFKQPGSNDSPYKIPVTGDCTRENDRCGVHRNSGIPNKAMALVTEKIGRAKAEKLFYAVLTKRLSETSNFRDLRKQTEEQCALMAGSKDAEECAAVRAAFDEVKVSL